jgi:biotin operon repressor
MGCKIAQKKRKGYKIAQLAKDRGKSAIKPKSKIKK